MKQRAFSLTLLILLAAAGTAQGGDEATVMVGIPHATQVDETTLTGGQPDDEQFGALREQGVKTVVNLRSSGEMDNGHQADLLASLGMLNIHIPVAGSEDLTREALSAFDRAVAAAGDEPALYHCASGNRVGALFALRAGLLQGKSREVAMEIGRDHGMTSLAESVESLLEAGELPEAD